MTFLRISFHLNDNPSSKLTNERVRLIDSMNIQCRLTFLLISFSFIWCWLKCISNWERYAPAAGISMKIARCILVLSTRTRPWSFLEEKFLLFFCDKPVHSVIHLRLSVALFSTWTFLSFSVSLCLSRFILCIQTFPVLFPSSRIYPMKGVFLASKWIYKFSNVLLECDFFDIFALFPFV